MRRLNIRVLIAGSVLPIVASGLTIVGPHARAQEGTSGGDPGVWRVSAPSWNTSWADSEAGFTLFRDVQFVDEETGFALLDGGVGQPSLLETERDDAGVWTGAWTVIHKQLSIGAVRFLDARRGVAFASDDPASLPVTIWTTHNGGREWAASHRPEGQVRDFDFLTPTGEDIIAVGSAGPPNKRVDLVATTANAGLSWVERQQVVAGGGGLNAVDFLSATDPRGAEGIAVGDGGKAVYTADGGTTWLKGVVPDDAADLNLVDVAFVRDGDETLAVAVGRTPGNAVVPRGGLLFSLDGGATWDLVEIGGQRALPDVLTSTALADARPQAPGGVVGYAAGGGGYPQRTGPPLLLEMQLGDPTTWAPAQVDPRAAAFPGTVQTRFGLQSVTVDPEAATAVAVGDRLMLERTPAGEGDALVEDEWWRCVPDRPTGTDLDEAMTEVVEDQEPANPEAPGARMCDERGEDIGPRTSGNFGATPALPCQLAMVAGETTSASGGGEFPCTATWRPRVGVEADGTSRDAPVPDAIFVDDDVAGQGRRLIAVNDEYVFLFDPDRLEQRGVVGFGAHGPEECTSPAVASATTFDDVSCFGFETGVVKLAHAPDGFPRAAQAGGGGGARTYDKRHHRVYLGTPTTGSAGDKFGVPPAIVVLSVTGDFAPRVETIAPVFDQDAVGRTNATLTHLAFDPRHGMLYALTETNYRRDQTFSLPNMVDSAQVSLHGYLAGMSDGRPTGELTRVWSVPMEDKGCRSTFVEELDTLAVDAEGDSIAFACAGHAGPHFGMPSLEANRVVTVKLQLRGRHPSDLEPANPTDIRVDATLIAGKVFNENQVTLSAPDRNVLVWNQSAVGANLWDYDVGGWIGAVPVSNIAAFTGLSMDGEHSRRGRMYASCVRCADWDGDATNASEGAAILVVDSLNVPAQVPASVAGKVRLHPSPGFPPRPENHVLASIPPVSEEGSPRVLLNDDGGALHVFEDHTAPSLERVSPDPDARTFPEVEENDAGDVKRIGRSSGYGARVWWDGMGDATAVGCQHGVGDQTANFSQSCGSPTLSYDWATDPGSKTGGPSGLGFGLVTGAVPGVPGGGPREMQFGDVQTADLENNKSGDLSQAKAVGWFYDGGPADDSTGATGDDMARRRGGDPHLLFDSVFDVLVDQFCSGSGSNEEQCQAQHTAFDEERHGDPSSSGDDGFEGEFGPYEVAIEEATDRAMREVDGERRVEGGCRHERPFEQSPRDDDTGTPWNEEDCLYQGDQHDPRSDARSPVDRRSARERTEVALPSECLDPGARDEDFAGSRTICETGEFGRTRARAELNALELVPDEASAASTTLEGFSVGTTGSSTDVFRDAKEGIVVEAAAWAADVKLRVADRGFLRIGEVRTTARARAKGTPGSAASSLAVAFEEVVISDVTGKPLFSCGRSDPDVDRLSGDPDDLPRQDECDPHEVADVISTAFAGRVQATTSARDTDPKVAGSPGGAQAMVRRDPVAVLSDFVINRIERHFELPALQLTIFNDGLRPNRMQIDLAAVYAEAHYEIGLPAEQVPAELGSIEVNLADRSGEPLAGGTFTALIDGDQDGQLSVGDAPVGECTTDAAGSCEFDGLDGGAYLVEQRGAPVGFMADPDPKDVFVSEGSQEVVEFVNGPDSSAVVVELVDPAGNPLGGGGFALVRDPDGDGAVGASDSVSAGCVTGGDGTCRFNRVSPASWVLHQTAAPRGYQAADDVAFALPDPGLVAEIRVVNGPTVSGRIVEIIDGAQPVSSTEDGPPWWAMVPKSLASLLLRGWVQALLFALTGALFGAPAYLAHRRRELAMAKHSR